MEGSARIVSPSGFVLTSNHTYVPFEFFQTNYSICSDVYTYWAACFTSTYTLRTLNSSFFPLLLPPPHNPDTFIVLPVSSDEIYAKD